jgi:hypothetical protein
LVFRQGNQTANLTMIESNITRIYRELEFQFDMLSFRELRNDNLDLKFPDYPSRYKGDSEFKKAQSCVDEPNIIAFRPYI